jgi:ribosomal protein S18 acetylase RimI-like enzyme
VAGHPVLSYLDVPGDPPLADLAVATGYPEQAVAAVLADLPGWKVATTDEALAQDLVAAGCRLLRFSHLYTLSLAIVAPALEEGAQKLAEKFKSLTFTSVEQYATSASQWDALIDLSLAAYPEGHPDAESQDRSWVRGELESLISGSVIGPLVEGGSEVAVTSTSSTSPAGRAVGLLLINEMPGQPPMGGPWVSEVCRSPEATLSGLGSLLLVRAARRLHADGRSTLSLVVTDGNPARATYERLGFEFVTSSWKVQVPGLAGTLTSTS